MCFRKRGLWLTLLVALWLVQATSGLFAQGAITPPKFGQYTAGDDYFLANYTQLLEYWGKLVKESPRMKAVEIGKTSEGRPMVMAIITSPANHQKLARYKEISQRLALAEGLNDGQARALVAEGKAVVWIDGGLHATECVNAQGLFTMSYQMVSQSDPETLRILNDVILLLVPANPDGMELVSNWYMRESEPTKRTMAGLPVLYNKYAGHDNNRDSYMSNLIETENIGRQMYIEWIPQIMYNQHQSGPAGTVLFMAPFRDPFNYNQDPLVPMGIDLVGAAIHNRFIAEGKAGAVMRNAASFSTWFNGGIRTTTGFHNQIGLLSEIAGSPTPMDIPLVPSRLLPDSGQPFPIMPQQWHQRQSIEYLITANRAILDIASKMREDFLFRIYRMGKNSIERGSRDNWTITPKRIAALQDAIAKEQGTPQSAGNVAGAEAYFGFQRPIPVKFMQVLHDPAFRDPRGYIIPSNQPDFLTATRFVNALIKTGIIIHRAASTFMVSGKTYPAGSYVVKAAQAFRPHVLDMFEPQDHPNDIPYPGGPPRPPYDVTGWTLAFQMGVQFDRILDSFDGPFDKIPGLVKIPSGKVQQVPGNAGYLLSHQVNDAFSATTRLLAAGEDVYWLKAPFSFNGKTYPVGALYIPFKPTTRPLLEKLAAEMGLNFDATAAAPTTDALKLKRIRIGLWDTYGGSMPSGWIRYIFEQVFPTPYELVFAPALDAGNLIDKFDVIIFPDGAIPGEGRFGRGGGRGREGAAPNIPAEYKNRIGSVTTATTVPQLRKFIEDGGTILAIGSSTSLGYHLGLPIVNHLMEKLPDGTERRLPAEKYYAPGSVLQVSVDNTNPIAYGLPEKVDVFFDNSPVFRLQSDAAAKGVRPLAWFSSATPLRSGWAWGQKYLTDGVAACETSIGKGKLYLFGPEITFRAQPHGTFKFLFNGIYLAGTTPVNLGSATTLTAMPVKASKLCYPVPMKTDVVEDYAGTKVADPYRWMENLDSPEVTAWIAAENKITSAHLEALPVRERLKKRITELWDYPKVGLPFHEGGRYFYSKNSGLQRQSAVYMRTSLDAQPTLVIDPNLLSPDGSISLSQYQPSPDGKLFAYALSEGGADWQTAHIRDMAASKDLSDEVRWIRFSGLSWTKDGKGFFYSRYPEPPKGKVFEAALSGQAIYYHRVGTPQAQDKLIYERKDLPTWFIFGDTTEDGRYLVIRMQKGSDNNNRLYVMDLGDPMKPNIGAPIIPLTESDDAEYSPFGSVGPVWYLRTDKGAPNRMVIALDVRTPQPANWKVVIPERKEAIQNVELIGGKIVAQYLVDVQSRVLLFGLDGKALGDIALPDVGSVTRFSGRHEEPEIFFSFSSPLFPTTAFIYDPKTKQSKPFEAAKPPVDISRYETKQLFAASKDGTRIPFFITAPKDLQKDGAHPTMIYGYGGFSIVTQPTYRSDLPAWLELGGIWVTANMRGGAEYGEAWHKAGMLDKKQNVFDDLIAVAEHLVKEKYTSPGKLGIMGASNGGLLVGAVEEQRPDLFAVALPAVGVMDMLRYDKFTGGKAWVTEYGSSSNPDQFKFLIKYSPLHNIKPGTCYPATLITTADHDDRVVPSHSFKFAATMQAAQGCDKPVLIRVETQASHGYRPTDKRIAELADEWAFAAAQMGVK